MKGKIGSVHKRGKKGIYVAEWMYKGKRYNISTKTTNKGEAERLLEEWTRPFMLKDETAIAEAIASKVKREGEGMVCPLKDAPARVKSLLADEITNGTWGCYESAWEQFMEYIAECHGEVTDVGQVTEDMAEGFLEWELKQGIGKATVNNKRAKMSRSWKVLKAGNVWANTRKRKCVHESKETFTPEEVEKLLAESTGTVHRLFVVAYHTGMRLSDCCRLDWRNIDWNRGKQGIIHLVPLKTIKTGKEIQVPVSDGLLKELREWGIQKSGLVCGVVKQKTINDTVNEEIRRILFGTKQRGMIDNCPNKTFHSFRHTFISDLGNKGVPLQMVKVIVGHMSEEMTQKYFHAQDTALDSIMRLRG